MLISLKSLLSLKFSNTVKPETLVSENFDKFDESGSNG